MQNYYETLGIPKTATRDEVKQAYRDLLKVWHPDKFTTEETRLRNLAEKNTRKILEAYEAIEAYLDSPQATIEMPRNPPPEVTPLKRRATNTYRQRETFTQKSSRLSREFKNHCANSLSLIKRRLRKQPWYEVIGYVFMEIFRFLGKVVYTGMLILATARILIPCVLLVLFLYGRSQQVHGVQTPFAYAVGKLSYGMYQMSKVLGVLKQALP